MDLGSLFFKVTASVETYQGAGPSGDLFAAAVTKLGFLDDGERLVQTETGRVLVSQTKWYTALGDADLYAPDSRVTINDRECYVTVVRRRDADGFGGPSHLEVELR